jgi:two-component system sensor kinase FixL
VNQSSIASAVAEMKSGKFQARRPFPVDAKAAFSQERAEEALRESEERLRALQNEFAHLARVHELGEMAAAVAHEINQPLTAIANYLNAGRLSVRESTAEALAQARRAMALAAEQGMRAGAIIRGLRSFALKGDGKRRIEAADALVDSAMALALLGAEAAGIFITRVGAGSGVMIEVDPVQIQQVLVNLLRNAVDALADNPVGAERRLTIAIRDLAGEGSVIFRIADSGPGIAPELRDSLFKPFVTSKPKGMGLGLSVCQRIVEAHGGTIEVESEDGAGAAFTVRLARATGPERALATAIPLRA